MIEWANLNKLQFSDTDFVSFFTFFTKIHVPCQKFHVLFQNFSVLFQNLLVIVIFSSLSDSDTRTTIYYITVTARSQVE